MGKENIRYCAGAILAHREEGIALVHSIDEEGNDVVTFPKGKIEKKETAKKTTIREIREECGALAVIIAELPRLDRISRSIPGLIKRVEMHLCKTQKRRLKPQEGDDHHSASYVKWKKLMDILTHPSDQEYIEENGKMIRALLEEHNLFV